MRALVSQYGTPFYVYDEQGIRDAARALINAFSFAPVFKEYFAVKATPNPAILHILREEGCGADASSMAELILSERAGMAGDDIMFTSNDTSAEEFIKARELGAIINLDDLSHLPFLKVHAGIPDTLCFRYNPGPLRTGNAIIGDPMQAKFGMTEQQLYEGYRQARKLGVSRFGLHAMVASNVLDPAYLIETADMLFEIAVRLRQEENIELSFINLGGGVGIPYRPEESPIDLALLGEGVRKLYAAYGLEPLRLYMECGRYITGPHGYLVSRVRHLKRTYKNYIGLDASMADLMRPGMYGAYHHISVPGREREPSSETYDVTGSLCENNDKFAIDRKLPTVELGDLVIIHDAGAHGHSMGFNYNGKLRHAEFLYSDNGFRMIRRAETLDDHFATLVS